MEHIYKCNKCNLCKNQKPLLDTVTNPQVFTVGLSAKKCLNVNDVPLSYDTKSGQIIKLLVDKHPDVTFYRTNLVKCLPLDNTGKLRYPKVSEINDCLPNLFTEIDVLQPKIVFLLGEKVYSAVFKHINISFNKPNGYEFTPILFDNKWFVPVQHPSYMSVYKRQDINKYIDGMSKIINKLQ